MRRVCTHMRMFMSLRTVSQLSISVRARLMPSLTSQSRCSSAEISKTVSSSTMVSSASERRRASCQPLQRACILGDARPLLREWCLLVDVGVADDADSCGESMVEKLDRVGDEEGEVMVEMLLLAVED
jgi:hypothetical protein